MRETIGTPNKTHISEKLETIIMMKKIWTKMNLKKIKINKDGLCMIVHDVQDMLVSDVRKGGMKVWMFKHH